MFRSEILRRALLAHSIYKYKNRKIRSMYIRPIFERRNLHGEGSLVQDLRDFDEAEYHHKYFRMEKLQFDFILQNISPYLYHSPTHIRPISTKERLSITLRYLATGSKQLYLAMSYRISPSSVCNIIKEVMLAICKTMEKEYLSEPSEETWKSIADGFEKTWNFPNACGAIDGKHIRIRSPKKSGSLFYNYKGFYSIVLLAVADHNYRFSLVDIGGCGSVSDGGIFKNSKLGQKMEDKKYKLPQSKLISENTYTPPVFLGDDAFPLKEYLMKPYAGRKKNDLDMEKKIYNYRHSRARMVVENTFGIFQARWRIFETPIDADIETAKLIVRTCIILHNFLNKKKDTLGLTVDRGEGDALVPGNWRNVVNGDSGLDALGQQGSNNSTNHAIQLRLQLSKYFMSPEGEVAWQERCALRGYD